MAKTIKKIAIPDKLEVAENLLSYAVVKDKQALVDLLKKKGVSVPVNPSDKEVLTMVLIATKDAKFKADLAQLLTSMVPMAADDFKELTPDNMDFTGLDDFGFSGATGEKFKNMIDTEQLGGTASTKQKTGVGKALASIGNFLKENVLTKENINAGIQIGLTSLNNKAQAKGNAIQQETEILNAKADEIRRQSAVQPKGSNAVTYIFIGVGVIALGAIIYLIAKNQKK